MGQRGTKPRLLGFLREIEVERVEALIDGQMDAHARAAVMVMLRLIEDLQARVAALEEEAN